MRPLSKQRFFRIKAFLVFQVCALSALFDPQDAWYSIRDIKAGYVFRKKTKSKQVAADCQHKKTNVITN